MLMTGLGIMKPWKKLPSVPNSTGMPPKKKNPRNKMKMYLILCKLMGVPG
jgi:hypothetical protein